MALISINPDEPNWPSQSCISRELIKEKHEESPRRIDFTTSHRNALKRETGEYVGKFSVPFAESIKPIFESETGLDLFLSQQYGNYWRSLHSEDEYQNIERFIEKMGTIVFLKDTLALSIAFSAHYDESGKRTSIGWLEYQAKYQFDDSAINELANLCITKINNLLFFKNIKVFCAVPPSDPGQTNLPNKIISIIEDDYDIENISNSVYWENEKPQLKELRFDEKWQKLDEANLIVDREKVDDKNIILFDDLYQSGTTMQYIAMKLLEAGAKRIFGVTIVKSRGDHDNMEQL
ncbi:MAG: hypothetical protein ACOCWW_02460 [Bacteroidota bacterium]